DAEPIRIGLTNQDSSPAGAFPEIRAAAQAGVTFINTELGGVGGRPIELLTCEATFDATVSQNCAQQHVQDGVIANVGGLDVTSNGALPILEANGIPQLGGIPANIEEQTSDHMFFFSGGTAGGVAAMLSHAAEQGATKAFIAFGDFPSFSVAAEEYAVPVAEHLGLEVQLAPFNLLTTDFLPVLTDAADSGAEAVIILAADSACVSVIDDFEEVVGDAQLYMTGACAADEIGDALGEKLHSVILNNEGPNDPDVTGGDVYQDVVDTYATEEAGGAGTVGFRGLMNMWAALSDVGPDATSADVLAHMRSRVDEPSFWGHPYTCDGEQVPGLPALCAPQQTLFSFVDGDVVDVSGGWIDTVAIFDDALG
ncbi:MAG: ABC transporter substrate-binding protein, partial [Acidimicrobiia bacterium]|nr:ABC transporter substrate-binding protein [Acidimicrobiia bacterium]